MATQMTARMGHLVWRVLVISPLIVAFLLTALILPLTFLSCIGHEWLDKNPLNSWVLGALVYTTTCYILSTSPGIIRIGDWLVQVDRTMREDVAAEPTRKP